MANINLLPWREELRKERQQQFFIAMGVTVALALLVLFIINASLQGSIERQEAHNDFSQAELDSLELNEVNELKEKKKELGTHGGHSRQGNRPVIVRVFDEFVRVLPEGVYFETLEMTGHRIDIVGVSESNNRISKLMRNMDDSEWFDAPNLTAVKAREGEKGSTFDLVVQQVAPALKREDDSE